MNTTNEDQVVAERLKKMLENLKKETNDDYNSNILDIIKARGTDELKHTCGTIIRRQEEISSLIGEVIDGSMPNPDDWGRLSDTVDEMDLLMRRLQRHIGDPR